MLSRILLGVVSAVAGGIFVSAASAAGPDDDPDADAACSFLPELTVAPPTDYPDVRLLNGYSNQAAFNPADSKRLVVGIVSRGISPRCYVKTSADGGRTWGALVQLPQVADAECSSESWPSITYAAGGGRVYAAYLYTKTDSCLTGVAFSVSTDQGATWSAPTKVFGEVSACDGVLGRGSFFASGEGYNDVRVAAAPDEPWVYIAAQSFDYHDLVIQLGSSGDQGSSWTDRQVAHIFSDGPQYYRGFALAAARKGNVLVAFGYQAGDAGYDATYGVYVRRASDHGASVDRQVVIADQSDSSLLSDPDIKIGPFGTAHLVCEGNPGAAILYKYSFPPYGSWGADPVRLDDDVPQANVGAPRLALGACGHASVLHATWLESLDVSDFPSKVLYTRKVARPGYAWSEPLKVGTLKNGIYTNGLAAAGPRAFSVFGGRTSPASLNKWGIAGSRVSSGVTCP